VYDAAVDHRITGTIPARFCSPGNRPDETILKTRAQGNSRLPDSVSRRDLLAGSAATVVCAFVPASVVRFATAATDEVLNVKERHCLQAMVSRIIPADANGAGARESGCAVYIESALRGAYRFQKPAYSAGLAALDSCAIARREKPFPALDVTEQDQILMDFERNTRVGEYADSAAFFELVRRHTLEGMFGDPSYGGNAKFAGWDLIGYPGLKMYVSPDFQQMNAIVPRSRVSADQLLHGSR
jgi:Gluconate 2-dehydrogenase subunit 3